MDNTNWEQHHPHESSHRLHQEEESAKLNSDDDAGEDQKDQGAFQPKYKKKRLVYGVDDRPSFQIALGCAS